MQAAIAKLDPNVPTAKADDPDDRIANRVPIECQVALRFENFDDFITEVSMNISATGMFVRSSDPQPAGSVLDFQFALADGESLIRGYGEVVWARRRDDGPERPAGMGIRFLHLDAESRELIHWTVTRRYITGAGPCDVAAIKSAMTRAAEREATARAARPSPGFASDDDSPPEEQWRSRYLEAGYAAVATEPRAHLKHLAPAIAVLALGGFYLLQAGSTPVDASPAAIEVTALEQTVPQIAEPEAASQLVAPDKEARPAPSDEPAPAVQPTVIEPPASPVMPSPEDMVKKWARSWSRQEVSDYLACYATEFQPAGGSSRDHWETQRRARINKPRWIQIELGTLVTELESDERARVTFEQSYRSDGYHDTVRKTLVMVRQPIGWRILEELVES